MGCVLPLQMCMCAVTDTYPYHSFCCLFFFHEHMWMSADKTTCRGRFIIVIYHDYLITGSDKPKAFDIRNINLYNIFSFINRRFRTRRTSPTVILFELCSHWHLESQLNVCLSRALRRRRWSLHMSSQSMTRLHQSCTGNPAFCALSLILLLLCLFFYFLKFTYLFSFIWKLDFYFPKWKSSCGCLYTI